ncbi:MAG: hypothetical protein MK212_20670 [Saprospiraceae bacterium]|nr:hypothetical protein [Saprospiraceae bacterium]
MGAAKLHSLHQESFHVMLNLKRSFSCGNLYLNDFCRDWRQQRKAKSGGINGNHRQLWYFLLSILPYEMDAIRAENKPLFEQLDRNGHYALYTNRWQLLRLITGTEKPKEDEQEDQIIRPSLSARTINNLIDRLMEANLIVEKLNYTRTGILCKTGQGNFLLILNGNYIHKYSHFESAQMKVQKQKNKYLKPLKSLGTLKDVQQPSNINKDLNKNINNRQQDVDNADKIIRSEVSSKSLKPIPNISAKVVPQLAEDSVLISKSTYLDLINTTKSNSIPKKEFYVAATWDLAKEMLWHGKKYNTEVNRVAQELIEVHYENLKKGLHEWREEQVKRYKQSKKYLALSPYKQAARERFMRESYLPKADKTAFEILSSAIRIQARNARKKGYTTYFPTYYFAKEFGFAHSIKYAKIEWHNMRRLQKLGTNDRIIQIAKLKVWVNRIVGNVHETKRREGIYRALVNMDKSIQKLEEKATQFHWVKPDELQAYIQQIKDSITFKN